MNEIKEVKLVTVNQWASDHPIILSSPADVAHCYAQYITRANWFTPDKEQLIGIALNVRKRVSGFYLVTMNLVDQSVFHARELFRPAIVLNARYIILLHNHPSGDVAPSATDLQMTKQCVTAGMLLQLEVMDHIIMGDGYYSIRQGGQVNFTYNKNNGIIKGTT